MTSDEIEKLKMDLLEFKENARYHKQEYVMLATKYNKMVKQKNKEITDLKLKISKLENINKKLQNKEDSLF